MPSASFYNVASWSCCAHAVFRRARQHLEKFRGTQLLARRPFKVAAVATTDHVIGALGRRSLFDHMALGPTAHELLQSLFILVLGLASVRTEASVALQSLDVADFFQPLTEGA